jgi:glycosyltransferase involved in cell wall biosynthesis
MRILYHHRTRAGDAQGIHIQEMAEALRKLGHHVDVFTLVPPGDDQHRKQSRSARPLMAECLQLGYNLAAVWPLLWRLWRGRYDMIYERYALFNFAGVLAARLLGKPIVLEVNSPLALEHARESQLAWFGLAQWTERHICNAATHVIVVSGPLGRILVQAGVSPAKLAVMPNGVNRTRFQVTANGGLRRQLGLEDKLVAGFVGWFRPWHGLPALLEAFTEVLPRHPDLRLLLVGDGPAMPELVQLAGQHQISAQVLFTGAVAHEAIPAYMSLFDIAVQPAANEYCCPMKLIEYLAMGKPVIAPRQDNITELVEDGRQGLLFEPGQTGSLATALEKFCSDAALRRQMGEQASLTIERRGLVWERNAARVVEMVSKGVE